MLCFVRSALKRSCTSLDIFEDEKRLSLAQQALGLEGEQAQLASIRSQQEQDKKECEALQNKLPQAVTALAKAEEQQRQSKARAEASKQAQEQGLECIKAVRALDLRIQEKDILIKQERAKLNEFLQQNKDAKQQQQKLAQQATQATMQLEEIKHYLLSHKMDEQLVAGLAVLKMLLKQLEELEQKQNLTSTAQAKVEQEMSKAQQRWEQQQKSCSMAEQQLKKIKAQRQEVEEDIEVQLKGQRAEELRRAH
ncbi:MAG: hypothetical protein D3923_19910, partial [Candidatus Electrothrix sp. AR3]|nr:hypothetical protein [Candidatus Electrothrix sp. AR3]